MNLPPMILLLHRVLFTSQDSWNCLPGLRLCNAHWFHDLLRGRLQRRENTVAAAKRRLILDETLAEEHRLHATRD